ncbi:DUF1592 domain-containing protein [Agaribacterium haliotis]|uniref:DUF1592 domain-containing protein n=1 Tax=Agaribacterium haliotis TaxID=2013869 RepID=UPI000BB56E2D|nr:DUF1592 domain-containing protein [Agaribacterium haliotis]
MKFEHRLIQPYFFSNLSKLSAALLTASVLTACGGAAVGTDTPPGSTASPSPDAQPSSNPGFPSPAPSMNPGQPSPGPSMNPGLPSPMPSMDPGLPSPAPSMDPGQPSPAPSMNPGQPSPAPSTAPTYTLVYAINAGANQASSFDGMAYAADSYYNGGQTSTTDKRIEDSDQQAVHQSERWGENFSYALPLGGGTYEVTLQFAEIYWNNPGERVMNVDIEGQRVISGLDLVAQAGSLSAYDQVITKVPVSDGTLDLAFSASTDAAKLSGIVVRKMGSGSVPSPQPSVAPSAAPSSAPSPTPSQAPSIAPSPLPSMQPSMAPSPVPSMQPSMAPSPTPSQPPSGELADYLAGEEVYKASCAFCHGGLEDSEKRGATKARIEFGIQAVPQMQNISLSDEQLRVLVFALNNDKPAGPVDPDPEPPEPIDGAEAYTQYGCTACHGNDGLQESQPIIFANYSYETFVKKIADDMPPKDPGSCVGECAEAVAQHIWALRPQISCDTEHVLPRRLRQLTKFEYVNTINDLFSRNDAASLASGVGSDTTVKGFDTNADANRITSIRMDAYWNAAEKIAGAANFSPWLNTQNCSQNGVGACFVEKFGRSAFRRDLSSEEQSQYTDLFNEGSNDTEGAQTVAQAMLVSPNFLYRTELGNGGNLTQYEIANLLSYTFWGSMPDAALLEKAKNNGLSNTAALRSEVERLIADDKAKKQFVHFGRQWLELETVQGLDRDANHFPGFTDQVAEAMDAEVDMFLAEIMLADGYNMGDFFESDFVYANQALANFYGLSGANGNSMQKIASNNQRGGLLSLGALLARNAKFDDTHPIKRGLVVRRNLLCQEFGIPPAVIGEVEPFDPNKPTRERFAAHTANEACASCHQFIDEIGFAFENYDAIGKFRNTEGNNLAIDASGNISGLERMTDSDTHSFMNLQDLNGILADEGLNATSHCLVETFQRMSQGVGSPDSCTTDNIAMKWTSGSLKDLWVEIVASQSFTKRQ